MKEFIINQEAELEEFAKEIFSISNHKIFLLTGDLGSGKTSFTKAMVPLLKCQDSAHSPTFSIINEYEANGNAIYHIDLYRMQSLEEVMAIGIEDYLYSNNYCFIEWPEIIRSIVPNEHHSLDFHILEDNKRKIIFS